MFGSSYECLVKILTTKQNLDFYRYSNSYQTYRKQVHKQRKTQGIQLKGIKQG